jgi:hypothetical protein
MGRRLLIITGERQAGHEDDVTGRYAALTAWTRSTSAIWTSLTLSTQDNTSTDRVPYVGPLHVGARTPGSPPASAAGA